MEIPKDIREKAYRLAYAWAMPDEEALDGATAAISAAILAERERCAKIAASHMLSESGDVQFACGYEIAAENIAAAIRGHRGTE